MTKRQKEATRRGAGLSLVTAGGAIPGAVTGHEVGKRMIPKLISKRMLTPSMAQTIWWKARMGNQRRDWKHYVADVMEKGGNVVPFEKWHTVDSPRLYFPMKLAKRGPLPKVPRKAAIAGGAIGGGLALAGALGVLHHRRKKAS